MDRTNTDRHPSDAISQARVTRRRALIAAATGMSLAAAGATHVSTRAAQEATPVASPVADDVSYLFVQAGFTSGALTPDASGTFSLVLDGAPEQTIFFSDRPSRIVGAVSTVLFLESSSLFDPADPPNAALVIQTEDGLTDVIVLELTSPVYDPAAATMTYTAAVLEGFAQLESTGVGFTVEPLAATAIPATFGPSSLFIDSDECHGSPWDPRC